MLENYSNCRSERYLTITAALFIALSGTVAKAADMQVTPSQPNGFAHHVTASRSPVIWGAPVTFTANLQQSEIVPGSGVTFYDECVPSNWRELGVGEFVSDGVELKVKANKLHLGSNNIAIRYLAEPTGMATTFCGANVVTVLPVAQ